ncbi:MAG TPA: hypothetical protein VF950_11830 [Planctomycetota bacterium]
MITIAFALLALSPVEGLALQDPPKPAPPAPPPAQEEKDLTPEEALKILKECGKLMEEAEALLNDSARGKALGAEKETLERVNKLLGTPPADPADEQKKILEKIEKLMGKSGKNQGETVDKLGDVIRRARAQQGQGQGDPQPGPPQQGQPQDQMQKPQSSQQPQNPATSPYDPGRNSDPINKFRSRGDRTGRWGDLPPRIREAMLSGKRDLDDFPAEYQQLLKEYFKSLSGD